MDVHDGWPKMRCMMSTFTQAKKDNEDDKEPTKRQNSKWEVDTNLVTNEKRETQFSKFD